MQWIIIIIKQSWYLVKLFKLEGDIRSVDPWLNNTIRQVVDLKQSHKMQ